MHARNQTALKVIDDRLAQLHGTFLHGGAQLAAEQRI